MTAGRRVLGRVVGAHRRPLVAVAVVAALTALVGGLAVPALDALATAGTRADLARATTTERDLTASFAIVETGDRDPQGAFDGVADDLAAAHRRLPGLLRQVYGPGRYTGQSDYLQLAAEPSKVPAEVALTADPGLRGRTHLLEGRYPRVSTDPTAIEVVLSRDVARKTAWPTGTTRIAESPAGATTLTLVGVYAADDTRDGAWDHVPSSVRASKIPSTAGLLAWRGAAYVAPGSFGAVAGLLRDTHGSAWFPFRADTVTADDRGELAEQVRASLRRVTPLPSSASSAARFDSQLPTLLDAAAARDATVATLTAALGSGPGVAALALQVLLARLLVERARDRWTLLAARGADRRQRGLLAAGLAATGALPGALVGAVASGVVAGVLLGGTVPAAVVVAASAAASVAALGVPVAAAAVLVPGARQRVRRPRTRLVVEAVVLVVTAAAVVLTARSGLATTAADGAVDPVAAALPVLVGATGVVLALRVLPAVLRSVGARARRRPALPAAVGSATAARRTVDTAVPLAVAVVGLAVALFASVVGSTLEQGVRTAADRSVAADVSVTSPALDDDAVATLRRIPSVAGAVGISTNGNVQFDGDGTPVRAAVLVADTAALARVQAGVPGALPVPSALRGRDGDGVPVVASAALARALRSDPRPTVDGARVRVVATAPDPVPFTASDRWLLVDSRSAGPIADLGSVDRVLLRLVPGADATAVDRAVQHDQPGVSVETAGDAERELSADPRIPGVRVAAVVAAVLGGLAGTAALAVAGILAGPRRRTRARLLAVLGATTGDRRRLIAVEALPGLVTAAVAALAVAAAVVLLMLPAADLRTFTGGAVRPPVAVDPLLLAAVVTGTLAALAAVLAVEVAAGDPTTRPPRRRDRP